MCTKFEFCHVGLNSCFVDYADRSSQFCLLAWGEECSRELCPTKCNNKIDLQFLNIDKLNNYKRLLNVTALVLRFINNLWKSLNQEEKVVQRYVTTEEYNKAEHLWLVFIQQDVTKINNYKQLEKDLNLQKDEENIIRCRGRLKNAPMEYDVKHPIILPKNSKFTELVVTHHKLVFHNGVCEPLNQIRTKFWISKPRNCIRQIIKKCSVSFAIVMKEIHFSILHLLNCHSTS